MTTQHNPSSLVPSAGSDIRSDTSNRIVADSTTLGGGLPLFTHFLNFPYKDISSFQHVTPSDTLENVDHLDFIVFLSFFGNDEQVRVTITPM